VIPEFHPAAAAEFEAAVREGLKYGWAVSRRLRNETLRVALLLCDTPNIGAPDAANHRRFPLRGFPFSLVYRIDGELLRIVAFAHIRKRPGYWSRRK
jgi:toxin ParE1/3/4